MPQSEEVTRQVRPSDAAIQERLSDMGRGLSWSLAMRRGFCEDCKTFIGDVYHHRQTFPKHTYTRLEKVNHILEGTPTKTATSHQVVLERAAQAKALRAKGFTLAEIAKNMGVNNAGYYLYYDNQQKGAQNSNHKAPKRRIISVLGSKVTHRQNAAASASVAPASAPTDNSYHCGYAAAAVDWMLMVYADKHGLDVSALKESVVKHLKVRE